jgi:hypothetical protein
MKCNWKVGALLIGGLVFGATPAMAQTAPPPTGSWQITYYNDEDNRTTPSSPFCIAFTTATGGGAGVDPSGTWQATGLGGGNTWQGSWRQKGDRLKWWGTYNGSTIQNYSTSHEGMLITNTTAAAAPTGYMAGQHQHYQIATPGGPAPNTRYIGAWWAQRVASC